MSGVLERYLAEHRRLLVGLAFAALANLLLYGLNVTLESRIATLEEGAVAERKRVAEAFQSYGTTALEARLLDTARNRVVDLRANILRLTNERYPLVDSKVKALQKEFGWTGHSMSFSWDEMEPPELRKLTVTFRLKGDYQTLRRFVSAVEQAVDDDGNDMFFAIEAIRLADSTDTGKELNLTVRLATHFHNPALAPPSGPKTPARPNPSEDRKRRRSRGERRTTT